MIGDAGKHAIKHISCSMFNTILRLITNSFQLHVNLIEPRTGSKVKGPRIDPLQTLDSSFLCLRHSLH